MKKNVWEQVITHPLVIEAVLVIVLKCLQQSGKVIITDGPETSTSWSKLMKIVNPARFENRCREANVNFSIIDLREDEWTKSGGMIVKRRKLTGDPLGSVICNLGKFSEFVGKEQGKYGFFGADYNQEETNAAHSNGNHIYKVSRSVIEADVFINLPKLKTHKKSGITCSLKNLVGINTYKNYLPHHTCGVPSEGGDQFPEGNVKSISERTCTKFVYDFLSTKPHLAKYFIPARIFAKYIFGDTKDTIRSGSWHGNDTLWRMVLDLNKILLYGSWDGSLRNDRPTSKKRYLTIVDAVVSGEGNGPLAPDRKETGLLLLGTDPVSVDATCAKIMGFDRERVPIIKKAFEVKDYPLCDYQPESIGIHSSIEKFNKLLINVKRDDVFTFKPPLGWEDYVEF
jgi:uncharacterized protein (DUF362 family)